MKFSDLNLDPLLQTAIDQAGFTECTPIQEQAMPHIIEGKDVAGLAQTGTGKTAAFLIPLMERILRSRPQPPDISPEQQELVLKRSFKDWRPQNFILILVPTRELAEQCMDNIAKFGITSGLRGVAVYGGTSYDKQREGFKAGVEFIAATPGRLLDLYKDNLVDLKQVRAVVFDEADRMFDMGFRDDMKYLLQRIPRERQYLVFSATLNFEVTNTAYQFGSEPIELNVSKDQTTAENVKDTMYQVRQEEKPMHLLSLLKSHNPKQAIIFTNFKFNVDRIAKFLLDNDVHAMGISSLLTQGQRNRVMEAFKADNEKNILVATDVAARGLDIKGVDLVINYDLPQDAESYVHRIGRTGRAGHTGTAYSLSSDRDVDSMMRIEEYLKKKLEIGYIEDKDLIREFRPMPHGEVNPGSLLAEAFNEARPKTSHSNDRGPRQGGRREGGPGGGRNDNRSGGNRNRGPRDGEPRREGQGGGPRGEGGRGPRHDGPRRDGPPREPREGGNGPGRGGENREPRREGSGPQGNRGPRSNDRQGGPNRSGGPNGNRGPRHDGPRRPPGTGGAPRSKTPPPPKTLGAKVKGFMKRLFGG